MRHTYQKHHRFDPMLWSQDSAGPIYHGRYYRTGTEPARSELNFLGCWHQVPHPAEGTPLPGGFRAAYCRLGTKPARSEVDFLGCWHYVPHLAEGTPLPGGFRAAYYRISVVLSIFGHFGCFGRSRDP